MCNLLSQGARLLCSISWSMPVLYYGYLQYHVTPSLNNNILAHKNCNYNCISSESITTQQSRTDQADEHFAWDS